MSTAPPPPPAAALGSWVGLAVVVYAACVLSANAWLAGLTRVAVAATEVLGLNVALQTGDEAEVSGMEVFASLERVATHHADALGLEALVSGATGLALLALGIWLVFGGRAGLRGVQVLLLVRLVQAAALAWMIGWRLGPDAFDVVREFRETIGRDAGRWERFDRLTADDGLLHAGAIAVGLVSAIPSLVLLWLTTLDVTRTWCGLPARSKRRSAAPSR